MTFPEGGHPCLTRCTPPGGAHCQPPIPPALLWAPRATEPFPAGPPALSRPCTLRPSPGDKLLEFQTSCLMIHSSSPGEMGNK